MVFIAFIFIVQALYHIGFWTFGGQTPGKMLVGIAVIRDDGSPIGFLGAIGRYIGYFVSEATLGIGYLMILWDRKNQGLHDKIADTLIIRDTKYR
ncbi:MAG: RDD family protein [Chloroflexi bacterium]|nr:RDD family protein [Chloroflexota bacterium]